MRSANIGIRAIGLATLIAFTGIAAQVPSVAATDPVPSPAPTEVASPPVPTPSPAPDPAAPVAPDPSAPADPAPAAPTPLASSVAAPVTTSSVAAPSRTAVLRARYVRAARIAIAQRHDRYRRGATGPSAFDCSGLVRYAYRMAGISSRLGGGHSARTMLWWARAHHKTTRHSPRIGDVVIYGNGSHAAIYIGNGRVISALNPRQGIRVTRLHALTARFTTFIRTAP